MNKTRSLEDVVDRALCVLATITLAHPGSSRDGVIGWLNRNGLYEKLSPEERAFVESGKCSQQDRIHFSWMNERLHVLCWVLGHDDGIAAPSEPRSGKFNAASFNAEGSLARDLVLANSTLRPLDDIVAAAALLEQQHTALGEKALKKEPVPEIEAGTVQERYAAINWVLCYEDLDWDEITADD